MNETITTAKFSDRLAESYGSYLGLQDEIEGLFESLEGKSQNVLDRRLWLSLHTGIGVTRSTSKKHLLYRPLVSITVVSLSFN